MRALLLLPILLALVPACGPNRTHPMRMPWSEDAAIPPLGCVPDLDGRIEARELTPSIGTPVSNLIGPTGELRDIDLAGIDIGGGERRWDFGTDYATDGVASIVALDPATQWYAGDFPGAEVAVPTDPGGAVDALYRLEDYGFSLLGLASPLPDPPEGRTPPPYAPPTLLVHLPPLPAAE